MNQDFIVRKSNLFIACTQSVTNYFIPEMLQFKTK